MSWLGPLLILWLFFIFFYKGIIEALWQFYGKVKRQRELLHLAEVLFFAAFCISFYMAFLSEFTLYIDNKWRHLTRIFLAQLLAVFLLYFLAKPAFVMPMVLKRFLAYVGHDETSASRKEALASVPFSFQGYVAATSYVALQFLILTFFVFYNNLNFLDGDIRSTELLYQFISFSIAVGLLLTLLVLHFYKPFDELKINQSFIRLLQPLRTAFTLALVLLLPLLLLQHFNLLIASLALLTLALGIRLLSYFSFFLALVTAPILYSVLGVVHIIYKGHYAFRFIWVWLIKKLVLKNRICQVCYRRALATKCTFKAGDCYCHHCQSLIEHKFDRLALAIAVKPQDVSHKLNKNYLWLDNNSFEEVDWAYDIDTVVLKLDKNYFAAIEKFLVYLNEFEADDTKSIQLYVIEKDKMPTNLTNALNNSFAKIIKLIV